MKKKSAQQKTTVGVIGDDTLAYTAGRDVVLDLNLVQADCLGSAAHVTMLSRMPVRPKLFTPAERKQVIAGLVQVLRDAQAGRFAITLADQDVHLAVERTLTERLGDLGKRIHTGRSRNDQVALDLRLYGRDQLLGAIGEAAALAGALLDFGSSTPHSHGRAHAHAARHAQLGRPVGLLVHRDAARRRGPAGGGLPDQRPLARWAPPPATACRCPSTASWWPTCWALRAVPQRALRQQRARQAGVA
jgi:argininosuccinate lyase